MTKGDEVRFAIAMTATIAAIGWFVLQDQLLPAGIVAGLGAVGSWLAGRSR